MIFSKLFSKFKSPKSDAEKYLKYKLTSIENQMIFLKAKQSSMIKLQAETLNAINLIDKKIDKIKNH